jgi:cell envelope opacity-associated protein A
MTKQPDSECYAHPKNIRLLKKPKVAKASKPARESKSPLPPVERKEVSKAKLKLSKKSKTEAANQRKDVRTPVPSRIHSKRMIETKE